MLSFPCIRNGSRRVLTNSQDTVCHTHLTTARTCTTPEMQHAMLAVSCPWVVRPSTPTARLTTDPSCPVACRELPEGVECFPRPLMRWSEDFYRPVFSPFGDFLLR